MKVKVSSGAWTFRMKYTIVQSNEEKISPQCVRRGLIELSTMSNGSTQPAAKKLIPSYATCQFYERMSQVASTAHYNNLSTSSIAERGLPRNLHEHRRGCLKACVTRIATKKRVSSLDTRLTW